MNVFLGVGKVVRGGEMLVLKLSSRLFFLFGWVCSSFEDVFSIMIVGSR